MSTKILSSPAPNPEKLSDLPLALVEYAPLPMALVEGAGHTVLQVNAAFCRLINKTKDELVGKPIGSTVQEQGARLEVLDRVYRLGYPESYTEEQPFSRPAVFWVFTMWPVMVEGHPVGVMIQVIETTKALTQAVAMNEALIMGSVHQHELTEIAEKAKDRLQIEIDQRQRVELELLLAQAQLSDRAAKLEERVITRTAELTATNQQLEALVYSIAHDLRAPLRSMQGFSSILVDEAGKTMSESARDCAHRIDQSAQFMDALLNDLLAYSRTSQQHIELTTISLEKAVGNVLSRLQKEIRDTKACVEYSGPWPEVQAHEPTLIQLLFNLTDNALKFVRPAVPAMVRLRAEERAGSIRVWVEDNGLGIASEYQEQIFRLFNRLDGGKYPGTGAGLAIVRKGAERMGGRAGVESTPGQGSKFWIELAKAASAAVAAPLKNGTTC